MELSDLYHHLPTDEASVALIEYLRWGDNPSCPYCLSDNITGVQAQFRHHCNDCNTSFSVKVGTFLQDSRLDIRKWIYAVWLFSRYQNPPGTRELIRELEVAKSTAIYVSRRIRNGMAQRDPLLSAMAEYMLRGNVGPNIQDPAHNRHKESPRRRILARGVAIDSATIAGRQVTFVILEDGRTIIQRASLAAAIGKHPGAGRGENRDDSLIVPAVVSAKNLRAYLTDALAQDLQPIRFLFNNVTQAGFAPTALKAVCRVYCNAAADARLWKSQAHIAAICKALLDELERGAGAQLLRTRPRYRSEGMRKEIIRCLARSTSPDLAAWVAVLPDEFYREMFRLRGWKYDEAHTERPSLAARLTYDLIFRRLPPSTLADMKGGITAGLKHNLEERSIEEVGHPSVRKHLELVISLMRTARSWSSFHSKLQRQLPRATPSDIKRAETYSS